MIASDADRLRWYHTQENVDAADAYIQALVDAAPPLKPWQVDRLRALGLTFRAAPVVDEPPAAAGQAATPQTCTTPPVPALPAPDATGVQAA